jgi:hypothetical protein
MNLQWYRETLENYTTTLNRLNKVFRALGNKTEATLMCIEFQNTTKSLLCYYREVIGII